jgi:cation diffusion facilitator CzcD-associated flavoprotein CzcO
VTVEHGGETSELTCSLPWGSTGYFDYAKGFTPEFAGIEDFEGTVIHPQEWPEDFDYAGKRVVVIGSGATAVTLIPAMADDVEHITMLQRSPSYLMEVPRESPFAGPLQRVLPRKQAHSAARWMHWGEFHLFIAACQRWPNVVRRWIRREAIKRLPEGYDVDTHFNPRYNPWDQRMCYVPHGDFFQAIRSGKASVVTDRIDRFTRNGIGLESGDELAADVIVTATGFSMQLAGGMSIEVDGKSVDLADTVLYKGSMLSGIPNFLMNIGYTNASWTLKVNLTGDYAIRLLRHMDESGHQIVTPLAPANGAVVPMSVLQSGYFDRATGLLPKMGADAPWVMHMNYPKDIRLLRRRPIVDEGVRFSKATAAATTR